MVVGSPAHKKAVQSLWVGKATVTVLDGVLNPANGRTEPQERILAADIRCRISHKSVVSTEPNEEAAQVAQSVVLYGKGLPPERKAYHRLLLPPARTT